jgi:DNA-binding transcriptional LysR family regulator
MDATETRELRYFVAVAEERHFGRAAERLGIAQPPLSRAIRQLERRLGVTLFDRTSRQVELTSAGEVLLTEGRKALDAVSTATRLAQRAGRPRLVLAVKPGGDSGLLPEILAEYETCQDAVPVDISFGSRERPAMLRDGRADVGLLYRPRSDLTGLDTEDLLAERQVVLLPAAHPLAGEENLRMADVRDGPVPLWPDGDGSGLMVQGTGELMHLVALGRLIAVLPESVRDRVPASVACLPVADAIETTLVVAWRRQSRSRQVAAFVRAAIEVAARHQATPDIP